MQNVLLVVMLGGALLGILFAYLAYLYWPWATNQFTPTNTGWIYGGSAIAGSLIAPMIAKGLTGWTFTTYPGIWGGRGTKK